MPKHVVSTAMLHCNLGSDDAPLIGSGAGRLNIESKSAARIDDHVPGVNIFPFGKCTMTGGPCLPITPLPWTPGASVCMAGVAALPANATLMCMLGGVIRVIDPGQHSVDLDMLRKQYERNEPTHWTDEREAAVLALIENALKNNNSNVEAAFKELRDLRQKPEHYYDSNLAIAADYLRARMDAKRYGSDVMNRKIDAYLWAKRHTGVPKEGPGPISPPSSLEEKYMKKGVEDADDKPSVVKGALHQADDVIEGGLEKVKDVVTDAPIIPPVSIPHL